MKKLAHAPLRQIIFVEWEGNEKLSQYKADDLKLHELERDVTKDWVRSNVRITVYGLENQTKPEKNMIPRVFAYEGNSYRSQLLANASEIPAPVITLVLYFGTDKHWSYPKTLKEVIRIPDGLYEYVNDFKIHVFEIAWLSDEEINRFTSDFRIVANFFANKRKNKDYIPDDPMVIDHVDEILKLLSVMTGDNRYEQILATPEKGQVKNMCDVAERLEKIGIAKGIAKGMAEGRAEGMAVLMAATKDARADLSYEDLVAKYGEEVAKNALLMK